MKAELLHRVHHNFGEAVRTLARYCDGTVSSEGGVFCPLPRRAPSRGTE